jgi:SSS family solute:Na+ symporter
MMQIHILDIVIFVVFTLGTVLFGISFFRKNKNVSDYTEAGGSVPGFIVGMSIFATYVSSISFLGLPGSAYSGNWNSFVFSLSIPLAAVIAICLLCCQTRWSRHCISWHSLLPFLSKGIRRIY